MQTYNAKINEKNSARDIIDNSKLQTTLKNHIERFNFIPVENVPFLQLSFSKSFKHDKVAPSELLI